MTANTTTYSWPYPEATDSPAGHTQIKALAEAVEASFDDSGWVTAGFVASTDWTVKSGTRVRKIGQMVFLELVITRSGATMAAAAASGNISDSQMVTIPDGYRPDATQIITWFVGASAGHGYLLTTGVASISNQYPTSVLSQNDDVLVSATYIVAA